MHVFSVNRWSFPSRMMWVFSFIYSHAVMAGNPVIPDYPTEGHWPYGPSSTSETWSDGNGLDILFYGEGTVLRLAKADNVFGLAVFAEVRTDYPVRHIDVLADGSLVAVSDGSKWVTLISTQGSSPSVVGRYEIEDGRKPSGLAFVDDGLLVVAVQPAGLWALDTSNPTSITLLGSYIEPGTDFVFDVEVLGDFAFLADDTEGVSAIDISDTTNMFLSNRFTGASNASHISIYGNTAFVSRRSEGLSILKLDVSQSPVVFTDLGTVDTSHMPEGFGAIYRAEMAINGLVVVSDSLQGNGVVLMDVADPNSPIVYGGTTAPNLGLSVLGNYAYASRPSWYNSHGIYVYDLNDTTGGVFNAPVKLDYLPLMTESTNVDVDHDIITISTNQSGVVLVDATIPTAPVTGSWINNLTYSTITSALIINDTLVVANYASALDLVDVSDIMNPILLPALDFGNSHIVQDVQKSHNQSVVVATGSQGVKWVDLSDPMNPSTLSTWVAPSNASIIRLAVEGDLVFAFSGSAAWVVDFSNTSVPVEVDSFGFSRPVLDADVDGDYLYLANEIDGIRIWDISDPTNVSETANFSTAPTYANGVSVRNNIAYIAADTFYGMLLVDVSNPSLPEYITTIETPGKALKVEAIDDILVLADSDAGLRIWSSLSDLIFVNGFD